MSKAIFPIRRVIVVEPIAGEIKLFRTLRDACNKLNFKNSYESIARYIKLNGKYEDDRLWQVYWMPVYGKHNPKGVLNANKK